MSEYDNLALSVFSASGKLLIGGKIDTISRLQIVQDYTITLEDGQYVRLNTGVVELMAQEWIRQNAEQARSVLKEMGL